MGSGDSERNNRTTIFTALGLLIFGVLWELRWQRLIRTLSNAEATAEQWIVRALHDPLTSMPNRTLLEDRIEQALIRSERNQTGAAVLFLDLDDFKSINDTYGHLVGDQMLIAVGQRFQQHLRASDTAARLGGDEFVVLLEVNQNSDAVTMVAERLRTALQVPLVLEPEPLTLTASIGVALSHSRETRPNDLLLEADRALLAAKRRGKNQVVLASKLTSNDVASTKVR